MVKEMTIVITVSDETSAECDDLLQDAIDDIYHTIDADDFMEADEGGVGDIDTDGYEVKWQYKLNVINP